MCCRSESPLPSSLPATLCATCGKHVWHHRHPQHPLLQAAELAPPLGSCSWLLSASGKEPPPAPRSLPLNSEKCSKLVEATRNEGRGDGSRKMDVKVVCEGKHRRPAGPDSWSDSAISSREWFRRGPCLCRAPSHQHPSVLPCAAPHDLVFPCGHCLHQLFHLLRTFQKAFCSFPWPQILQIHPDLLLLQGPTAAIRAALSPWTCGVGDTHSAVPSL